MRHPALPRLALIITSFPAIASAQEFPGSPDVDTVLRAVVQKYVDARSQGPEGYRATVHRRRRPARLGRPLAEGPRRAGARHARIVAARSGQAKHRLRVDPPALARGDAGRWRILSGLVGRAAGVRPLILDSPLGDPVQELADVLAPQLLDGRAPAPLLPLPERREVFVARPARPGLGTQATLRRRLEGRRHLIGPGAAVPCSAARPVRRVHSRAHSSDPGVRNRTEPALGAHEIRRKTSAARSSRR
jgi:hypothetical protein